MGPGTDKAAHAHTGDSLWRVYVEFSFAVFGFLFTFMSCPEDVQPSGTLLCNKVKPVSHWFYSCAPD